MDIETKKEFEKLATMVADGFSGMQKKMDDRFDFVDERLDALEKRVGLLEGRVSNMEEQLKNINDSIKSLRHDSEEMPDKIDSIYSKTLSSLEDRVRALEKVAL